jgi:26S proteasome regulatory subunit N12
MDLISAQFEQLRQILEGSAALDAQRATSLIQDLKTEIVKAQSESLELTQLSGEDRIRFRDILEYNALLSIRTRNLEEFERVLAQLKTYYFGVTDLPPSERMPLLLSIHLIHILALKKLVNFNIELQLARSVLNQNPFIDYVADLHQSVIDNSFSRLFSLEDEAPSPLFKEFTEELKNGARNNHADSIEQAYKSLTLSELCQILHFETIDEARLFVRKRNWDVRENGTVVVFRPQNEPKVKSAQDMLIRAVDLSIQISALA